MINSAKRRQKIYDIRGLVWILVLSVCLMAVMIESQVTYAESKKVSGTIKASTQISRTGIRNPFGKVPRHVGWLQNIVGVYSSTDPAWNNTAFYTVLYALDANTIIVHTINTHPGGDQTFLKFDGKITTPGGADKILQYHGRFLGGTGKFKNIRGNWKMKREKTQTKDIREWEAEYEIK
jgi:hypothetical protein